LAVVALEALLLLAQTEPIPFFLQLHQMAAVAALPMAVLV
jgi:hypothetical protein